MGYRIFSCMLALGALWCHPVAAQDGSAQPSYRGERPVHVVPAVLVKRTLDSVFAIPVPTVFPNDSRHEPLHRYRVRVGTFAVKENATKLKGRLEIEGYSADVRPWVSKTRGQLYTVSVGDYASAAEATRSMNVIRRIFKIDDLTLATAK